MSQFDVFMSFYGLLLGLGVAELFGGFARLVRARTPPAVGLLTPAIGITIFLQIMGSLSDVYRGLKSTTVDLDSMALPTLIGVAFFFAAIVVVPDELDDWSSLDDYYFSRRRWTVGLLLTVCLLTIVTELPAAPSQIAQFGWGAFGTYVLLNAIAIGGQITALIVHRRAIVLTGLAANLIILLGTYSAILRPFVWGKV